MKKIMDVVNEFKGAWPNYSYTTVWTLGGKSPLYMGDTATRRTICTSHEFDSLVLELQNWQPTKNHLSKFERDIEIELFGHSWIVGIIYDSFDTLHEFDIQSLFLCALLEELQIDLTTMLDSCSSLYQQFECAVIAKLEEERQNV